MSSFGRSNATSQQDVLSFPPFQKEKPRKLSLCSVLQYQVVVPLDFPASLPTFCHPHPPPPSKPTSSYPEPTGNLCQFLYLVLIETAFYRLFTQQDITRLILPLEDILFSGNLPVLQQPFVDMGDSRLSGLDSPGDIDSQNTVSLLKHGLHVKPCQTDDQKPHEPKFEGFAAPPVLGSLTDLVSGPENEGRDSADDSEYRSGDENVDHFVLNEPPKPRKISQKKATEQANFRRYLVDCKTGLKRNSTKNSRPDDQSLAYMIKSWEGGEKIINSPRDYQLELFERAKKENTIAVLDTGKYMHPSDHHLEWSRTDY